MKHKSYWRVTISMGFSPLLIKGPRSQGWVHLVFASKCKITTHNHKPKQIPTTTRTLFCDAFQEKNKKNIHRKSPLRRRSRLQATRRRVFVSCSKRFLFLQHTAVRWYSKDKTTTQKPFRPTHCSFLQFLQLLVRKVENLVLARMGSNNSQTDAKLPVNPASRVTFCQRNKSENGSFVSKLRNHFHEFIHASMDEHKTCLRNTIQKIFSASNIFGKNSDNSSEGENSFPVQTTTRN